MEPVLDFRNMRSTNTEPSLKLLIVWREEKLNMMWCVFTKCCLWYFRG